LRDAWAALSASQPERALELVQIDERTHPSGPLSEERAALQIVALARLNRLAEARAAAAAFAKTYPTSVHGALVEHAVRGHDLP
jgi:outer membrane protein assembly factor BamD (BamD/ComL family)